MCLILVLSGCKDAIDPSNTPEQKVLTSTRYLPVEEANLTEAQTRLTHIYAAIDSLGKFVAQQDNPELHTFYVQLISDMKSEIQTLKKQESVAKTNIQSYTFYINQYGEGIQEVELIDE